MLQEEVTHCSSGCQPVGYTSKCNLLDAVYAFFIMMEIDSITYVGLSFFTLNFFSCSRIRLTCSLAYPYVFLEIIPITVINAYEFTLSSFAECFWTG
jgi:hypothetical protein